MTEEWDFYIPCPYCEGTGEVEWEEFFPFSETPVEITKREKCYACKGTGIAKIITCVPCETMKKVREHRESKRKNEFVFYGSELIIDDE